MEARTIQALIQKARSGDRDAFGALFEPNRGRLERVIQREMGQHLRQEADPEDVLQETSLRAFSSIQRFEYQSEESFPRWLATIAKHVVLELATRQRRGRRFELKREPRGEQASPSRIARRGERFERLEKALDQLSQEHREVIFFARIEGLRIREIAHRMNRTENAVLLLLSRALKKLKTSFGDTESLHLPDRSLKRQESADDPQ